MIANREVRRTHAGEQNLSIGARATAYPDLTVGVSVVVKGEVIGSAGRERRERLGGVEVAEKLSTRVRLNLMAVTGKTKT